jgi:hypothetical protein
MVLSVRFPPSLLQVSVTPGPGLEHALKCVIKEWCIYKCVVISPLVIQHTYVSLP